MNEEIKILLLEILKDGRELTYQHAPIAIQDILLWANIQPFIALTLCLIFAPLTVWRAKSLQENDVSIISLIMCLILLIASIVSFIVTGIGALHANLAPYSYIIDYVSDL